MLFFFSYHVVHGRVGTFVFRTGLAGLLDCILVSRSETVDEKLGEFCVCGLRLGALR